LARLQYRDDSVNEIKATDGTMDTKTFTNTPAQSLIASPPPIDPNSFCTAAVFKDVFPAWNDMAESRQVVHDHIQQLHHDAHLDGQHYKS
jgi:hypothetical protein